MMRKLILAMVLFHSSASSKESHRPYLRYMTMISSPVKGTLEINGDRSYFSYKRNADQRIKVEINAEFGIDLYEKLYKVPKLQKFLHQGDKALDTHGKYVLMVMDERPKHYSQKTIIYVFLEKDVNAIEELESFISQYELLENDPRARAK